MDTIASDGHSGATDRRRWQWGVAFASVVISALLFLPNSSTPVEVFVLLMVVGTVGPPAVMGYLGYTDRSFVVGITAGALPAVMHQVRTWAFLPLDVGDLKNIAVASIGSVGLVLPVTTLVFFVGLALRDHTELVERRRRLGVRVAIVIAVSVVLTQFDSLIGYNVGVVQ